MMTNFAFTVEPRNLLSNCRNGLGLNKAVIFLQGCFPLAVRKPFRHWLFLYSTAHELQLKRETSKAVEFHGRQDALSHLYRR